MTLSEPLLQPDCTQCAGLCCVALAFDRCDEFALDKPAGVPCPNLTAEYRCRIHADLAERGFAGCVRHDCLGAGQRVTQEMFGGRSWRDNPALAEAMFEAFRILRHVHALLDLLRTAGRLSLTPAQAQQRAQLRAALLPEQGWTLSTLTDFERGTLQTEVQSFLASLRDNFASGDQSLAAD